MDKILPKCKDIIIVGAGISGLSTAWALKNTGHNVKILEARNRVGGRVNTDYSFGYALDLGASWIHGITDNEISSLAKSNNVKTILFDYEESEWYSLLENTKISSIDNEFHKAVKGFLKFLKNYRTQTKDDNISIASVLTTYSASSQINSKTLNYLNHYFYTAFEIEISDKIENLSLINYDLDYIFLDEIGGDAVIPDGYIKIFEPLYKEMNVQLETVVNSIKRGDRISIETNKGTYTCDYVVITVPLGVLKSGKIFFDPDLSDEKKNAISKMGFGVMEKIIIEFSEAFWDDYDSINLISSKITPFIWSVNLHKFVGKNTLMFFIGGDTKYIDVYNTSKSLIEFEILEELKSFFPNKNIKIVKSIMTNWKYDEFTLGSYTTFTLGSHQSMIQEFSKREGNLFFAGEHTECNRYPSVQSAWLSGIRIAKEILTDPEMK